MLIPFGSPVVYYDNRPHANTIKKQHGRYGIFMGYNVNSKDYRVLDKEDDRIVEVYDVRPQ